MLRRMAPAEACRALLFADEDQQAKTTSDPVVPARLVRGGPEGGDDRVADGAIMHNFRMLVQDLGTIVRNSAGCAA